MSGTNGLRKNYLVKIEEVVRANCHGCLLVNLVICLFVKMPAKELNTGYVPKLNSYLFLIILNLTCTLLGLIINIL